MSRLTGRVGALTALLAAVALGLGVSTPVRSGANCTEACLTYPYSDAPYIARDYLWIYPVAAMVLAFMALMVCLYHDAPPRSRALVGIGVALAVVATASLTIDYAIQLAVVQPSQALGETDGLALVSMANPHGVFIALENLGYLLMGVSFGFAAMCFTGRSRLERALRVGLLLAAGTVVVTLVGYTWVLGLGLDYSFEVAVIGITWLTLIVFGVLVAALSRHRGIAPR